MCRLVLILMLGVLLTASGCERKPADRTDGKVTSEDGRRDAGQTANAAAEFSQQTKEEFRKNLDARLNEMDAKIVKLREKGRDLEGQAKAEWDRTVANLETKRDATRAKLSEVGHSTGENWQDVRDAALSAWGELEKASRNTLRGSSDQ